MIHITEKYDPLNTEEKITALFEELKNNGCVYSAELEVSILYKIRKAKLQIFLKGILKQLPKKSKVSTKGGTEKLSSPKKSFCDPSLWKKKNLKGIGTKELNADFLLPVSRFHHIMTYAIICRKEKKDEALIIKTILTKTQPLMVNFTSMSVWEGKIKAID